VPKRTARDHRLQLQNAEAPLRTDNRAQTCPLVAECRQQQTDRAAAVDTYLKQSPEVPRWLRGQKVSSEARDFGAALIGVQIPMSGNCGYDRQYVERYWMSLRGDFNGGAQRSFDLWRSAGTSVRHPEHVCSRGGDLQRVFENTDK
jgi:hypothetical protein